MKDAGKELPEVTGIVSCVGKEDFDFRDHL
jgi:hypothetical protein